MPAVRADYSNGALITIDGGMFEKNDCADLYPWLTLRRWRLVESI